MRRSVVMVLATAVLAACGTGDSAPPASAEQSIALAAQTLKLTDARQVASHSADGQVLAVFVGQSGVLDGAGLVVVDASAPWPVALTASGSRRRADPASLLVAASGDSGATVTYLYGVIENPLITTLEIDLSTGTCDIPVGSPAFAVPLEGEIERVPERWRFLDVSRRVVFDPTAPRGTPAPTTSPSGAACA